VTAFRPRCAGYLFMRSAKNCRVAYGIATFLASWMYEQMEMVLEKCSVCVGGIKFKTIRTAAAFLRPDALGSPLERGEGCVLFVLGS